jgi:caffeoyl-CoA O-methyltransferase
MPVVDPAIDQYLKSLTPARRGVLTTMEAYAREHEFPIIGPLVGRFLQQLVKLTSARRIFEMGSGFGYSALWMALAMDPDGRIDCTETDAANVERGRRWLKDAGVGDRVAWHHGDALALLREADGPFDLILNDVDKHQYPDGLKLAWPRLRRGGVMVTDNTIWSGRVVTEDPPSESTQGILTFNREAYALPDALATILPLRDGLLVAVKV